LRWSFGISRWSFGLGVEVLEAGGLAGGQDVGVYEIGEGLGYLGRAEALERWAEDVRKYARVEVARFYVVAGIVSHSFSLCNID